MTKFAQSYTVFNIKPTDNICLPVKDMMRMQFTTTLFTFPA